MGTRVPEIGSTTHMPMPKWPSQTEKISEQRKYFQFWVDKFSATEYRLLDQRP